MDVHSRFHALLSCPNYYYSDGDCVELRCCYPPGFLLCLMTQKIGAVGSDYHLNAFAVVVVVDIEIFFVLNCGLKRNKVTLDI